jgi:hypothetical protein
MSENSFGILVTTGDMYLMSDAYAGVVWADETIAELRKEVEGLKGALSKSDAVIAAYDKKEASKGGATFGVLEGVGAGIAKGVIR